MLRVVRSSQRVVAYSRYQGQKLLLGLPGTSGHMSHKMVDLTLAAGSQRSSIFRGFAVNTSSATQNEFNQTVGAQTGDYENLKGKPNSAMDVVAKVGVPGVTIIRDEASARRALEIIKGLRDRVHAWDTETIDLEVKEESPVGKGKIMCFTGFFGPDVDFGTGPRLFIDNMTSPVDLVQVFKEYFEDETYLKGWFNYGFDRHIFFNHGVDVK